MTTRESTSISTTGREGGGTPVSAAVAHICFSPTYASARANFLWAADAAGARTDVLINDRAKGPDGSALTTDVAVLGPEGADKALLIVSGTHGPEGFSGSAAQVALLRQAALGLEMPDIKIVLVHAINPWGFAHLSRTTENNVDLNRNFIDWAAAPPENPLYAELHPLLCPSGWSPEIHEQAERGLDEWIQRQGHGTFVDVMAKGQYTHADGLHYGGRGPEWSNEALGEIVSRHLSGVGHIGFIDWHTALGDRGQPFFLCFNEHGGEAWERACRWWGRENVETRAGFDGSARPNYSGLLFQGVQRFARQAEVTGAVIEFGTQSSRETRQALRGDQYLKFATDPPAALRSDVRERMMDAFAPFSIAWKRSVLGHAMAIQRQALHGMVDW